jgi:hypothetical protein
LFVKCLRFLLCLFAVPLFNLAQAPGPLTNQRVILQMESGVRTSDVVNMICAAPRVSFNLTPSDTDQLLEAGISEEMIKRMAERNHGQPCTVIPSPSGPPRNRDQGETLLLPDATPVRLRLMRNVSSAYAKAGDRIYFEVLDDVKVSHYPYVVINREATAVGTIIDALERGVLGRAGKLFVRVDFVWLANGDKVALSGGDKNFPRDGHVGALAEGQEFVAFTNGEANLNVRDFR